MGLAGNGRFKITAISAGKDQTLALLGSGEVLGWGGAGSGRVTSPYIDICSSLKSKDAKAVYITRPSRYINISAGYGVSLGITDQNQAFIWGFCQVGIGGRKPFSEEPTFIDDIASPSKVVAGQFLHAAIGPAGQVYSWGFSTDGALGRVSNQINASPGLVNLPAIRDIAIGDNFMLALSMGGDLYAWGSNSSGQLGIGHLNNVISPQPIHLLPKTLRIAAGSTHVLALTADGDVFGWGSNHFGQVGIDKKPEKDSQAFITRPLPVRIPERVVAVSAGMHYSLALGSSGRVYSWGWNGLGQLGQGDLQSRSIPTRIPGVFGISEISAGEAHAVAIGKGPLFGWGCNESGQLGDSATKQMTPNAFMATV